MSFGRPCGQTDLGPAKGSFGRLYNIIWNDIDECYPALVRSPAPGWRTALPGGAVGQGALNGCREGSGEMFAWKGYPLAEGGVDPWPSNLGCIDVLTLEDGRMRTQKYDAHQSAERGGVGPCCELVAPQMTQK